VKGVSSTAGCLTAISISGDGERVQKEIAHWDKQNNDVPVSNCVLKVRGEIIKDGGL